MKFSLKSTTATSTITIANVISKVAAFTFFLAPFLGVVHSNSYVFETIGNGDETSGYYGRSVAISGDANTMAVGAYKTWGIYKGIVRLYSRDGTDWSMSQQINATAESGGSFGWSVDLSHNGSTLAVGERYGDVYIYDYNISTSKYDLFNVTGTVDSSEVRVSGDGSTVGVTSLYTDIAARIFVRDGDGFQQRGPTFTGYGPYESGIALSYNGTIVAIGHVQSSSYRGHVEVFQWRDANGDGSMLWVQMGSNITGDASGDLFGEVGGVSITYDGQTVSVGASGYDRDGRSQRGVVRVYDHDSTDDTWNKIGSDLVGDNADDYFSKNALSSDGTYLAVGAHGNGGNGKGNYVKLLAKNGNNFEIVEKVIPGELGQFGYAVDISADGAAVVIGDLKASSWKGRAYLLSSLIMTEEPSAAPSTSPSFSPTAAVSKTEFALAFLKNETVIDFAGNSTDKEIIIKSLISDKALRDSFVQTIWVGPDCKFKFVDEYPEDTTLVTISNNDTLDVVEGKTKEVTSEIDIDTSNIASKGVHANSTKSIYSKYEDGDGNEKAKVEFCIRTDYGKVNITTSDGEVKESSLNFYKVKIAIDFLLEFGFTSSNVTIKEEQASEAQETAEITTNLKACDCPANAGSNSECYGTDTSNAKTYNQNDILSVCVYDPDENSIITSFKDVELGNGQISTQVIDPDGRPTALASVSRLNEEMAVVNTRIVSAFFDTSGGAVPAPINVKGTAIIGFKTTGARKLANVGLKGARNTRKLQDGGEGTFDVEVILSDEEEVDGSPGFDVLEYGIMSFVMTALVPIVLL